MKFPRSRRIQKGAEFAEIRRQGSSHAGRFLVLGYAREGARDEFSVGLITSKKVGNAVARNRVRRRLRAILQKSVGSKIKSGSRLVLIARNHAARATSDQLEKELVWLLHRAKLVKPKSS